MKVGDASHATVLLTSYSVRVVVCNSQPYLKFRGHMSMTVVESQFFKYKRVFAICQQCRVALHMQNKP